MSGKICGLIIATCGLCVLFMSIVAFICGSETAAYIENINRYNRYNEKD